ncbi:nodal modulator 1 [Tanacetum coccineum]
MCRDKRRDKFMLGLAWVLTLLSQESPDSTGPGKHLDAVIKDRRYPEARNKRIIRLFETKGKETMTETIDALNNLEFEFNQVNFRLLAHHDITHSAMGVVTLLSGQPKEGLSVEARSDLKGSYEETVTDSSGSYHLRGLHPNTSYTIRVIVTRSRFAAENDNVVKLDDSSSVLKQGEGESKTNVTKTISSVSADDLCMIYQLSEILIHRAFTSAHTQNVQKGCFSRDGAWWDDAISKEDSEDVDDEGIVEKMVKVNLPKVSPNGTGVSTNWIYFNVRQSTTRRRLLLAIREANGGFD